MKYIAVDKCRECEWYTTDPIGNYYCHTAQKVPKNDAVIPPWCPLPDLPEADTPAEDETKTNKAYQKWIGKSPAEDCPECVDTDCETCPGTGKRDDNPTKQEG